MHYVFKMMKSAGMDTEQLLLFLTANADDGGFTRVITANGVDDFMERALKLEVAAAAIKEIETHQSKKFRKEALAQSPARGGHRRQRSIEGTTTSPDVLAMQQASRGERRRKGGGGGGGVCGATPIHE